MRHKKAIMKIYGNKLLDYCVNDKFYDKNKVIGVISNVRYNFKHNETYVNLRGLKWKN